ncbi:MAG: STAS-like domain-containing protein [Terriglobales bacterium]
MVFDFSGIGSIGQALADEIFGAFAQAQALA